MRFAAAPGPGQVWGFTSGATIQRQERDRRLDAPPRGERGDVSRWGHLVFDDALTPPRRVEVLPYVRGGASNAPGRRHRLRRRRRRRSARSGIGSAATLSATVNPDFGQVEQDPAVLNLSVFETFFPEKRRSSSRTAARSCRRTACSSCFTRAASAARPARFAAGVRRRRSSSGRTTTTIIGAAKLTGKIGLDLRRADRADGARIRDGPRRTRRALPTHGWSSR